MDWIAVRAMFGALVLGAFVGLIVGAECVRRPEEHTAYARGYAACADSVRAAEFRSRPHFSDATPAHYDTGYVRIKDELYGYKRIGPETFRMTRVWP